MGPDYSTNFVSGDSQIGGGDAAGIVLTSQYLDRIKSGDEITVHVLLRDVSRGLKKKNLHYATKTFTLYEVDDYRKRVLKNRVKVENIRAFPLPKLEANALFGPIVAANYFVVRLSVRNPDDRELLINTGLIVAGGRAIVEPSPGPDQEQSGKLSKLKYTIPVNVVPQSATQMYTLLDDEEVSQARPSFFRGFELVGALATAIAAPLTIPSIVNVKTGLGIVTNTLMPGLKQAWPDRWPGYKRNIVANAMPDLFKVPRRSASGHKYLFFSKSRIEGMITDQAAYTNVNIRNTFIGRGDFWASMVKERVPDPPYIAVVSLAFDHMTMPFEIVSSEAEKNLNNLVLDLQPVLPRKIAELQRLKDDWQGAAAGKKFLELIDLTRIKAAESEATNVIALIAGMGKLTPSTDQKAVLDQIENDAKLILGAAQSLLPAQINAELVGNPVFGLAALRKKQTELQAIADGLRQGRDPQIYEDRAAKVDDAVTKVKQAIDFYLKTATTLSDQSLFKKLLALPSTALPDVEDAKKLADPLSKRAEPLKRLSKPLKLAKLP